MFRVATNVEKWHDLYRPPKISDKLSAATIEDSKTFDSIVGTMPMLVLDQVPDLVAGRRVVVVVFADSGFIVLMCALYLKVFANEELEVICGRRQPRSGTDPSIQFKQKCGNLFRMISSFGYLLNRRFLVFILIITIVTFLVAVAASFVNGRNGKDGRDGRDGRDGKDGRPGETVLLPAGYLSANLRDSRIGQIVLFPQGDSALGTLQDDFIQCDGQTITREDYPSFFKVVGLTNSEVRLPLLKSDAAGWVYLIRLKTGR